MAPTPNKRRTSGWGPSADRGRARASPWAGARRSRRSPATVRGKLRGRCCLLGEVAAPARRPWGPSLPAPFGVPLRARPVACGVTVLSPCFPFPAEARGPTDARAPGKPMNIPVSERGRTWPRLDEWGSDARGRLGCHVSSGKAALRGRGPAPPCGVHGWIVGGGRAAFGWWTRPFRERVPGRARLPRHR